MQRQIRQELRTHPHGLGIGICGLLAVAGVLHAAETTYRTIPNDARNVVQFVSDAPLEKIVGRTSHVEGWVEINFNNLLRTTSGRFEVDLTTIDTGIKLRNQHMRENHLETDLYPRALFELTRFVSADHDTLAPNQMVSVVAEGQFSIHGVSRTYQIPLSLYYDTASEVAVSRLGGMEGNILVVNGDWTVALADHDIDRPQFLFLRLAAVQKVSVSFALTDKSPAAIPREKANEAR